MVNAFRLPFVFLAMLGLLLGLWTGLIRIGWDLTLPLLPAVSDELWSVNIHHGAIMVGGFLGTLISLEKVIPLKNRILFFIPVSSASSIVFFFLDLPLVAFVALTAASVGLTLVFVQYLIKSRSLIYLLMIGGGLCWIVGNVLLLTRTFYPLAFPWWLGFVLLIITSERVELMSFLPVSRSVKKLLLVFLAIFITGILFNFHGIGRQISGGALIAVALWLMRFDIVGISIHKNGLTRFVAVALLSGYISMLLTGVFFMVLNNQWLAYDAIVHTFFLGFAFSMIFAHGPIILPGVLGISIKPYHKIFYVWLVLLHLSWIIRIGSDIVMDFEIRKISGIISAISILGYFASVVTLIIHHQRHAKVL